MKKMYGDILSNENQDLKKSLMDQVSKPKSDQSKSKGKDLKNLV